MRSEKLVTYLLSLSKGLRDRIIDHMIARANDILGVVTMVRFKEQTKQGVI